MNKIYKLVWSKVRNCYVAVAEIAKSHTKAPKAGVVGCVSLENKIMAGLNRGFVAGAFANGRAKALPMLYIVKRGLTVTAMAFGIVVGLLSGVNKAEAISINATGDTSYIVGNNPAVAANTKNVFVLGNNATVNNGSEATVAEGIIVLGNDISVSLNNKVSNSRSSVSEGSPIVAHSVAIGDKAIVGEENALAFGYESEARALNALAIGTDAKGLSEGAAAIGHNATVNENSNFAITVGYNSSATGEAANAFGYGAVAGDKFAVAFGRSANAAAEAATAIGNNSSSGGNRSVAIGNSATVLTGVDDAVAIGSNSKSLTNYNVAIGSGSIAKGWGDGDVAIGKNAKVGSETAEFGSSVAIGGEADVQATYGTAIGSRASVTGQNSIALGAGSVSLETGVVSVGSGIAGGNNPATRRIINVTNGTKASDAATVGQTVELVAGDNVTFSEGTNSIGQKKITVNATVPTITANGTVTSGNTGLINGGTVYSELRPTANGDYIKIANTTAQNLSALDAALKATDDSVIKNLAVNGTTITFTKGDGTTGTITTQDNNTTYTAGSGLTLSGTAFSVNTDGAVAEGNTGIVTGGTVYDAVARMIQYDEGDNTIATLAGQGGTKVTNLKAATLSRTSTDAVTGSQLYATNQNIAGFASDIRKNKDNISNLNTSVTAALESVSSTSSLVDTLNNTKADASLNNLTAAGRQVISTAAANAVQEYMRNNSTAGTNSNSVNTSLRTLNRGGSVDPVNMSLMSVNPAPADTNFVVYDDTTAGQITLEGPVGTGTKITGLADGELSAASTDAVNGAQLYEVTQHFDDFQSALSSNNTSIANAQTDINKMKTMNIQLESDVNTLKTEMETGFNVTIDGAKVKTVNPQDNYIDFIAGDGLKIEDDNGSIKFLLDADMLGGVSQEELNKKADLTYVDEQLGLKADKDSVYTKTEADGLLARKADLSYVDTELGSVRTALDGKADKDSVYTKTESDDLFAGKIETKDALEKKANRDASNIDAIAWANKLGTGAIEEGNNELVKGGTVYEAISRISGSDMIAADREAGSVRIAGNGRYDDLDVVDISKSDGTGRVLTGIVTNPQDKTSAANVGYVEAVGQNIANAVGNRFNQMDDKVNKVGASAAALAALTPASFEGDEKWSLAASVGNYRDATAGAVGAFYRPTENVMMNVRGSFGNSENMVAAGVAVALNKGDIPGVTKRQLAKAVTELRAEREADKAAIASQANEIAELRAMVHEMAMRMNDKNESNAK